MDKKGFVYILSNPSMPGLVKVGMTKKVPTERIKEPDFKGKERERGQVHF